MWEWHLTFLTYYWSGDAIGGPLNCVPIGRVAECLPHLCASRPSLTIHPDKVRVASGQMAGVDKDGKVSRNSPGAIRESMNWIHSYDFYNVFEWTFLRGESF